MSGPGLAQSSVNNEDLISQPSCTTFLFYDKRQLINIRAASEPPSPNAGLIMYSVARDSSHKVIGLQQHDISNHLLKWHQKASLFCFDRGNNQFDKW